MNDIRKGDAALRGRDGDEYVAHQPPEGTQGRAAETCSRQRCYAIIKEIARRAAFPEKAGCHTMRKTFALDFYKASGGDIARLQNIQTSN